MLQYPNKHVILIEHPSQKNPSKSTVTLVVLIEPSYRTQVPKGVFHYVESGQNFEGGFKLPNPGEELVSTVAYRKLRRTVAYRKLRGSVANRKLRYTVTKIDNSVTNTLTNCY